MMSEPPTTSSTLSNVRLAAAKAANALATALSSPYGQQNLAAQGFADPIWSWPNSRPALTRQTIDGYTLSSTYLPTTTPKSDKPIPLPEPGDQQTVHEVSRPANSSLTSSRPFWLTPGHHACTYAGCTFRASQRSVEIHMMDRHLIYPENWKEDKHWDADVSLKGKLVPISGTSIVLDTVQAVDDWVADRRRKWPSTKRIEEKESRRIDAQKRGELEMDSLRAFSKRRRMNPSTHSESKTGSTDPPVCEAPNTSVSDCLVLQNKEDQQSDDDGPPEEMQTVSSTAPTTLSEEIEYVPEKACLKRSFAKSREARQHKRPQQLITTNRRNPLLHCLLSSEIRHTVSNLSQAIHFIVENGFFDGVELYPGDSTNLAIQVLGGTKGET